MVSNLHESAPAKINLHLKVTARRADGYHELDLSFWPLPALADGVELEIRPQCFQLFCSDPHLSKPDNLCLKAAKKYADATEITPEWFFRLEKNIPIAAGLGGGSSDAAAVLRILNRRYQALDATALAKLALSIGADVPYFLDPRPAFASGIGEKLIYPDFKFPKLHILLVNPNFPVSAAWAYRNLDIADIGISNKEMFKALQNGNLNAIAGAIENDLEKPVLNKFPLLRIIKQTLLDNGAIAAAMSGSGPTIFALGDSVAHLEKIQSAIEPKLPPCRFIICS